ncbi:hypothetical protein [Pelagibaculum spongiae]|uniref:Uncharacterized protein n=1 Tax=Pelagibaculum spongiae TaxID=2080658 RepID=A0A2V1GXY6_9GAMM|nr:hypothetical protein [Pelagibaculum spongiae]PVZ66392.1 hypothetical protein DC094_17000 [Pelagibaculum spongiae]
MGVFNLCSNKILFFIFFLLATPLSQAETLKNMAPPDDFDVKGTARDLDGQLLYYEYHDYLDLVSGNLAGKNLHNVTYLNNDFSLLATKHIRYFQPVGLVSYKIKYARQSFSELVSVTAPSVEASNQKKNISVLVKKNSNSQSTQLIAKKGSIIDAGFDAFIRTYWLKLQRQTVTAQLLLMPAADWLSVNISKIANTKCQRNSTQLNVALCLQIKPDSFWLSVLAPDLMVGYNENKKLSTYLGPSNLVIDSESPMVFITYQHR